MSKSYGVRVKKHKSYIMKGSCIMKDYYFTSTNTFEIEECESVREAVEKHRTAHVIIQGSKKKIHLHFRSTPPHGFGREVSTAKIALQIIYKYAQKWGLSNAIPYVVRESDGGIPYSVREFYGDYTATIAFGGEEELQYDDYGRQLSPAEHQKYFEEWIINSMAD